MHICDTYDRAKQVGAGPRGAVRSGARGAGRLRRVDNGALVMNELTVKGKLVSAEQLLDQVFAPECRPSLRWLRSQTKAKSIPHIRIGHLVFFDVEMVRTALVGKRLVRGRTLALAEPQPV
jgi:hypothetical protein